MNQGKLTTAIICAACLASSAQAQINGFGGNGTNWTLNTAVGSGSSPAFANNVLDIANGSAIGTSAFYNTPQYVGTFSVSFTWQNVIAGIGSGFTFCLQNTGTNAVGNVGGNYLGFVPIPLATGVAFNLLTSATAGIGYAPQSVPFGTPVPYDATGAVDFNGTDPIAVQMTYGTSNLSVTVTDTLTSSSFTTNYAQNLTALLGGSTAYVGFTAGGAEEMNVTISNFVFTPGAIPNPPSTFPVKFTNSGGNIDVTELKGNESDGVIAINPTNPTNLFIACNTNVQAGLFGAVNAAAGAAPWTPVSLANLPAGANPALAWDTFGNLFLAYADAGFSGVNVAVSTNGGTNFNFLTNLATGDFAVEPKIAVGSGSVWVLYKDYSLAFNPLVAQGAAVTGLNTNESFGLVEFIPGSTNNCGFGDIAVGPQGQVMVAFQNLHDSSGKAKGFVSVDLDGLGANLFNPPVVAASNVLGGNTVISASPDGQGINGGMGLAWDTDPTSQQFGRVYLVVAGAGHNGGNDTDILLSSSTDSGKTWGSPLTVNDDNSSASQFLPRAAVDPTTGILALSWFDTRTRVTGSNQMIMTTIDTNMPPMFTNMTTNYTPNFSSPDTAVIYGTVSLNGGVSVQRNQEITASTGAATNGYTASKAVSPTDFGDYEGLAFYGGTFYPTWADNSGGPATNPDGGTNFDIVVAPTVLSGLADVSVTETLVNTTNVFQLGSVINYLLTVSNAGPTAVTAASFVDVFPSDLSVVIAFPTNGAGVRANYVLNSNTLTWAVGALPINGFATILVRTTAVGIGNATNVALVSPGSGVTELLTNNNITAGYLTIHGANMDLSMTATPSIIGFEQPSVTYTLTVSNGGPVTATGVTVSNTFPTNLSFTEADLPPGVTYSTNTAQNSIVMVLGTMTNGQTDVLNLTARAFPVQAFGSGSNYVTNSAVVSGIIDPIQTNNTASVSIQLLAPDLAVGLTGSPTNIAVGDTVTYTIGITNVGNVPAVGVTITNLLPTNMQLTSVSVRKGTYTTVPSVHVPGQTNIIASLDDTLAPGQSSLVIVTATAISLGQATNVVSVGNPVADLTPANNIAKTVTGVVGPDMAVSTIGTPASIPVGQQVTYMITVSNLGQVAATGVVVTNTFPAGLAFEGLTAPTGTIAVVNQNVVTFAIGAMTNGQTLTLSVTVTGVTVGKSTNIVVVGDSVADTTTGNNTNKIVTTVTSSSSLIANVTATPGVTGVFITWNTPDNATAQVAYGVSAATNITYLNPALTTNHVVELTGLTPDTNYVYQIRSTTPAVPPASVTNASGVVLANGTPATSYTNSGSFSTPSSVVLTTSDPSYAGPGWTIGSAATGIFTGPNDNNPSYEYVLGVSGNPTASATYNPTIVLPAFYDVSVWYPIKPGAFSANTPMIISGTTNAFLTNVDQTVNGGGWEQVASAVYFAGGTTGNLAIDNNSGDTTTSVVANGVRWSYILAQDVPATADSPLPPWWANFYFGTNTNGTTKVSLSRSSASPSGYPYYADYVLGTDPTSNSNKVQLTFTPGPANKITVSFGPYQGGRIYTLQSSTDLSSSHWLTLTNKVSQNTNTGAGSVIVSQPSGGNLFYRLSATLSPSQ